MADAMGDKSRTPVLVGRSILAVGWSSPLWVLLIRRQLRRRLNPNVTYPRPPVVPPGTPPALVETSDTETGRPLFLPVSRRVDAEPAGGAVFRPLQIHLPPVCCVCLEPQTAAYAPPMAVDDHSDLAMPVCADCRRRLQKRWWARLAIVTLVSAVGAIGFGLLVPLGYPAGRWAVAGIVGFFFALVGGIALAGRAARPYRYAVVDRDRDITRFAAVNPGYTALVADAARAADAVPVDPDYFSSDVA